MRFSPRECACWWAAKRVIVVGSSLALAGCAWTDSAGTRHHLVLGFGVIASSGAGGPGASSAASVERVSATGAFIGTGPVINGLMIGWASMQAVRIDPGAEVMIEARSYADGTLSVTAQSIDAGSGTWGGNAQKGTQ